MPPNMNRESWDPSLLVRGVGLAAVLAVVLGAKFWLISAYGSSTPFWDQWVEANNLYRPFLVGELRVGSLFLPHNEHRIFLPRLVSLALFAAEGRWDPIAQMLVNAAIHALAISTFVAMLSQALDAARTLFLASLAALLFALPFGWANTLVGFQTPFSLLALLAPLSLWLLCASAAWSPRWWLGTLVGIASYLTIASGALTLPAFIILALIQLALGVRKGGREWLGVLAHAIVAAIIVHDIPVIREHQSLAPASVADLLHAVSVVASWPVSKSTWPFIPRALIAVGLYAPIIALAYHQARRSAPFQSHGWLIVGTASWTALQVAALVYGRSQSLDSRYLDLLLLAPLANAAALLCLQSERPRTMSLLACIWFAMIITSVGYRALNGLASGPAWRHETAEVQTRNVKNFLATGDFATLQNKPRFEIPYPVPEDLRDTLSDPLIRSILPAELLNQPEPRNKLKSLALHHGHLLIPIGLAMLFMGALLVLPRSGALPTTLIGRTSAQAPLVGSIE